MKIRFGLQAVALSFVALTWISCDKKNNTDTPTDAYTLSGAASGAQERPVPVTETTGMATLTGDYHKSTKVLNYSITWMNLTDSVKAMHFHGPAATPDSSAGVQVAIPGAPAPASGTVIGATPALTADQEAQLLAGQWYYNLHTKNYPAGEIRGNIIVTAQ